MASAPGGYCRAGPAGRQGRKWPVRETGPVSSVKFQVSSKMVRDGAGPCLKLHTSHLQLDQDNASRRHYELCLSGRRQDRQKATRAETRRRRDTERAVPPIRKTSAALRLCSREMISPVSKEIFFAPLAAWREAVLASDLVVRIWNRKSEGRMPSTRKGGTPSPRQSFLRTSRACCAASLAVAASSAVWNFGLLSSQ